MSHQSSPNVSSSTILSAFTSHDGFAMSEASRSSHLAHYTNATHGSGFFPNGGHLGPTLHMMPAGGYAGIILSYLEVTQRLAVPTVLQVRPIVKGQLDFKKIVKPQGNVEERKKNILNAWKIVLQFLRIKTKL